MRLVQQRFKGNKDYSSLRLVYSSMNAGYKFLDMLHKAKIQGSQERQKVVGLLRKLEKSRQAKEAKRDAKIPPSAATSDAPYDYRTIPKEDFMLRNVAGPFEPARYVGEARPLSSLKKRREVPTLVAETCGFPFLRYGKPQSEGLDHMIRSHKAQWMGALHKLLPLEEEVSPRVQWEDVWEENIEKARCEEEGMEPPTAEEMDPNPQSSYTWAVQVGRLWYELKLERLWQDFVARGKALEKIIREEKRLQELEDRQGAWETHNQRTLGDTMGSSGASEGGLVMPAAPEGMDAALYADVMEDYGYKQPTEPPTEPISHPPSTTRDRIRVMPTPAAQPAFSHWQNAIQAYLKQNNMKMPEADPKDPFINPLWGKTVELADGRLRNLMSRVPNSGANARFRRTKGRGNDSGNDEGHGIAGIALARATEKSTAPSW